MSLSGNFHLTIETLLTYYVSHSDPLFIKSKNFDNAADYRKGLSATFVILDAWARYEVRYVVNKICSVACICIISLNCYFV